MTEIQSPQPAPRGYKLVPIEPTPEMESECMGLLMSEALIYERQQGGLAVETIAPVKLWAAMLAAAPAIPAPEGAPCTFPACQFNGCPKTGCYVAPAEGDAQTEAPSNPYAHSKTHASVWQAGFDAGRQHAKQVPIEITGSEWEICEAAIKESRERYTLSTSRAAFQAGALFACRAALAQPNVQPKGMEQLKGWRISVREDAEQSWLCLSGPRGQELGFSAERGSLRAEMLQDLSIDLLAQAPAPGAALSQQDIEDLAEDWATDAIPDIQALVREVERKVRATSSPAVGADHTAVMRQALDAMLPAMGAWAGTCAWHGPLRKAIAAVREALGDSKPPVQGSAP